MVWSVPAAVRRAFMGTHTMTVRCSVTRGQQSLGDIKIVGGSINATYNTQGGRDGSITVPRTVIEQGLLNPLSDQVSIYTGIEGFVEVPVFTGRVDTPDDDGVSALVEVQLLSRAGEAIRAAFESPWAAQDNAQARDEMVRILKDVDLTWGVDISRANTNTIGRGLVWEDDRGQALDQLARGASLIWMPDRTGGFEIFTNPYVSGASPAAADLITFRDGADGTVVNVQAAKSREGIYNSVTVVAEKYGNQAPIRVTVRDIGVNSPTRWGGVFGKQNLVLKSQIPIDLAQATLLATRVLQQSLALQRTWTIDMPHFPLLDPGDVFSLWYQDEVTAQVVQDVSYPLDASENTTISSRELRVLALEILTL